jgi:hypothetical protein
MKIVNESLLELYKFEKKINPLDSVGVGKIFLIEEWLKEMKITNNNYTINDDYIIDLKYTAYLNNKKIKKFPDYIQFGKSYSDFYCIGNGLISLDGCPKYVNGDFACDNNNLTTLEGCPEKIIGYFWCKDNKIKFTKEDVLKLCDVHPDRIVC